MSRLVDRRVSRDGYDLIAVMGTAINCRPPSDYSHSCSFGDYRRFSELVNQARDGFQLGMAGYLASLWIAMRIQPLISAHLVGMASVLRTVIWRFSIFSWVLLL